MLPGLQPVDDGLDPDATRAWVLQAARAGALVPWVQPIFTRDLAVASCEVLARCPFPDGRLRAPSEFAGALGSSPDWQFLDGAMLLHAAALARELARCGAAPPVVAWNTAAPSLTRAYLDVVTAVVTEYGLAPAALCLELTEQVPLVTGESLAVLREVRRLGVRLALDDVGESYAFLRRVSDIGFDVIKLDRALVLDAYGAQGRRLLGNVVRLAHDLGAEVVAEGVEDPALHELLLEVGCDRFQGQLYGAAVTVDRFLQHLRPAARAAR